MLSVHTDVRLSFLRITLIRISTWHEIFYNRKKKEIYNKLNDRSKLLNKIATNERNNT